MTELASTALTTSQKVDLSAQALGGQGQYGAVTELSRQYEVSRPTVYGAAVAASAALTDYFEQPGPYRKVPPLVIDAAQLHRAVVALRVVAPNSVRDIEELVPIIYPGVRLGYGTIQAITAEAESKAMRLNTEVDLSAIHAGALDEMFSQGDPVLAGVDLDWGYLFALALRESRGGDDWAQVLTVGRRQGLKLDVVVKDAALGIASGVREVYPNAEQRDDCFHALYEMGKVRQRLERKAYAAMVQVEEMQQEADRRRRTGKGQKRAQVAQLLWRAEERCAKVIAIHDGFENAARLVREAMEFVDLETGQLRQPAWMQAQIQRAALQMKAIDHADCRKVGTYLFNRAPGLALYAIELTKQLGLLAQRHGQIPVRLACIVWRLQDDLARGRRPWQRHQDKRRLVGACLMLKQRTGPKADAIVADVDHLFVHRHRASSAIEGFNAALRPYLYVHKGVTQGFLDLFRAYYNLRTRRWGRHKGTTAHELITGQPVADWLTLLGYPPSNTLH